MASVTLTGIWVSLAADPSQSLFLPYGKGLQAQPSNRVATVVAADGTVFKTRQPGYQAKLTGNAQAVTPQQRDQLEYPAPAGWLGETVCIRDHRGRKFYGYWDPPQIAEHDYNDECDVSFTFNQITWVEVA